AEPGGVGFVWDDGCMDVAGWLEEQLPGSDPADGVALERALQELLGLLERIAVDAVARLGERAPGSSTLRLPKSRLAALGRCERSAVALAREHTGPDAVSRPMLVGVAHDRFVIHQLHGGRVREPLEDLRDMLLAEGEWELLDAVD